MRFDETWSRFLEHSLVDLDRKNLRRRRVVTQHSSITKIVRGDKELINFGGNDYLGLRHHPAVIAAAVDGCAGGAGSGASPAVTGYSDAQQEIERRLASFNKTEDALVFSSGFAGNLATIAALVQECDVIFSDSLNHASLIDGCRLSKAKRCIYTHNDADELKRLLAATRHQHPRALIVTESIFSMDGDEAPLVELAELAERFNCGLVVDEAHATGIYGSTGSGLIEELKLGDRVLCKLGTLSKAVGCLGGFVCGSNSLVEHILNYGRSYMFSTALPSSVLAAASASIELIQSLGEKRNSLRASSLAVREEMRSQGWKVLGNESPIIPLIIGEELRAVEASRHLEFSGLFVPAIRPPTVPAGTSRLRFSLSTAHTPQDLQKLCECLGELSRRP